VTIAWNSQVGSEVPVTDNEDINEALEALSTDYPLVTSARRLRVVLEHCIRHIKKTELSALAYKWQGKIGNMPRKMSKEGINYVLLGAYWELERSVKTGIVE